jgi:hypothetical protein
MNQEITILGGKQDLTRRLLLKEFKRMGFKIYPDAKTEDLARAYNEIKIITKNPIQDRVFCLLDAI